MDFSGGVDRIKNAGAEDRATEELWDNIFDADGDALARTTRSNADWTKSEHVVAKSDAYAELHDTHPETYRRLVKTRQAKAARGAALAGMGGGDGSGGGKGSAGAALAAAPTSAVGATAAAANAGDGPGRSSSSSSRSSSSNNNSRTAATVDQRTELARTHPATAKKLHQMRKAKNGRARGLATSHGGGGGGGGGGGVGPGDGGGSGSSAHHTAGGVSASGGIGMGMGADEAAAAEEITILPGMRKLGPREKREAEQRAKDVERVRRIRQYKVDASARVAARQWRQEQATTLAALTKGRAQAFCAAKEAAFAEVCGLLHLASNDVANTEEQPPGGVVMGVTELSALLRVLDVAPGGLAAALEEEAQHGAGAVGQAVVLPLEGGASGLKDLAVVLAAVVGRPLRREQLLAVHQELRDRVTGPAEALRGCAAVGKFHHWQVRFATRSRPVLSRTSTYFLPTHPHPPPPPPPPPHPHNPPPPPPPRAHAQRAEFEYAMHSIFTTAAVLAGKEFNPGAIDVTCKTTSAVAAMLSERLTEMTFTEDNVTGGTIDAAHFSAWIESDNESAVIVRTILDKVADMRC
jgi:hypothetical protein